ncbi:glycine betaine ABC transporter substrate-binding protein OsmF [Salinibius halmophilus]|uniref:glycine betaine ABC transporter substrate-binding protein OsmF n=1 Tax=Salinibius halmophilus TaxID=1853216 RepID=UPI000E65FBDE|nr:ABC transporter substrate-binding protein [Salinibius halmophilus]
MKSLLALLLVAVASLAFAKDPVVVGSKIDTEGSVLGQIILQTLSANDIEVVDRIQLGATNIVRQAIITGEIDIYPEYTGNGAFFFDQADSPVWKNAEAGYERVAELDLAANNVVWLSPAPANNTWAMSVRADLASANNLQTMEDLARFINDGGDFKFAASAEFVESPAALPAFQTEYGFELTSDQLLVLSGGNTAATMRAAALATDGVNGAMTYGTDGGIAALGLVVLEDTMGAQPVYLPAPVVRAETLAAYPELPDLLASVFAGLTKEVLQDLNSQVQVEGRPASEVAAQYLSSRP